jgi:hypothetical protein
MTFQQPKFKDFKQQSIERQNALTNATNLYIAYNRDFNIKKLYELFDKLVNLVSEDKRDE